MRDNYIWNIALILLSIMVVYLVLHIISMIHRGYRLKAEFADLRKDEDYDLHFKPIYHYNITRNNFIDEGIAFYFGHYSLLFYFEHKNDTYNITYRDLYIVCLRSGLDPRKSIYQDHNGKYHIKWKEEVPKDGSNDK